MTEQLPQWPGWQAAGFAVALFHQASHALFLTDPVTERVLAATPPACRLAGLSRAELLHTPIRSLINHEQGWQDWVQPSHEVGLLHREGFHFRTRQPDSWAPVTL